MKKQDKSIYKNIIQDKKRKKILIMSIKNSYFKLLHAAMAKEDISVRELAKEANVSPTIIQELKSGKRKNITLDTFNRVLKGIGYQIIFEPINRRS